MVRKLYKSPDNRVLFGVCGGLGEYFGIDPVIIRLLVVATTVMGGAGLIGYIIAVIIIPESPDQGRQPDLHKDQGIGRENPVEPKRDTGKGLGILGVVMLVLGGILLMRIYVPWIHGSLVVSALLICFGLYFIIKRLT